MIEIASFYCTALSPFGARLRLIAAITGHDLGEAIAPAGGTGSVDFKTISPFGQVPVLIQREQVLIESLALMEYVVEISGHQALLSNHPFTRARTRAIAMAHDNQVVTAMRPIFSQLRAAEPDASTINDGFADVTAKLEILAGLFDPKGLAIGGVLSLADLSIAPFKVLTDFLAVRFGQTSPYSSIPRLANWADAVGAVPEVAADAYRQRQAIKTVFR